EFNFDSGIWSRLKEHLFEVFSGKCAYCEAKVQHVDWGQVEHYRPKKKVEEDPSHPGYWWLAYNYQNFLPCCTRCNCARAKMNRFRVRGLRARRKEDLSRERPLLLNPYKHKPQKHLKFIPPTEGDDNSGGHVIGITTEGKKSIEVYNLGRRELVEQRQV